MNVALRVCLGIVLGVPLVIGAPLAFAEDIRDIQGAPRWWRWAT